MTVQRDQVVSRRDEEGIADQPTLIPLRLGVRAEFLFRQRKGREDFSGLGVEHLHIGIAQDIEPIGRGHDILIGGPGENPVIIETPPGLGRGRHCDLPQVAARIGVDGVDDVAREGETSGPRP